MRRFLGTMIVLALLMGLGGQRTFADSMDPLMSLPNETTVIEAVTADSSIASPDRIRAYAEKLNSRAPSDLAGVLQLGIAWQMAHEPARARQMFERAVQLAPNNPTLYPRLASVAVEGITVYVRGRRVEFSDVQPQIINGRTLVPFRAVAEALGADVKWDPDTETATVTLDSRAVRLTKDRDVAMIGLNPTILDVPASIIPPGRFAVPLRFLSEAFGYKVHWVQINPGSTIIGIYQQSEEGL